ncbi:tail fiber protein [Methylogaea oryzae]|uniref:tail fiber protein n=1 Tax=Methylogaea oryzae TaxID=1295382 RepID=UPI0009E8C601
MPGAVCGYRAAYGGDGQNYFNLPNLQGQVPMAPAQAQASRPASSASGWAPRR